MSVPPFPPPAEPRPAPVPGTPPPGITLGWFPEEQDYLEAFRAVGRKQRTRQAVANVAVGVAVAVLGAVVDQTFLVLTGVVLTILGLYVAGPGLTQTIRRAWRGSPALQGPRQMLVSPEQGVTEWFPGYVGTSAWSRYAAVVETERVFVLTVRDLAGNHIEVIAKRGLPPGMDPAWFGDALRAWVAGGGAPAGSR